MINKPFMYFYGDEASNNFKIMKDSKTCICEGKIVSGEVTLMNKKITLTKFIQFLETYKS